MPQCSPGFRNKLAASQLFQNQDWLNGPHQPHPIVLYKYSKGCNISPINKSFELNKVKPYWYTIKNVGLAYHLFNIFFQKLKSLFKVKIMVESIVTKNRLLFRYATDPTVYCHEIVFLAIIARLAIATKAYCPSLFVVIFSFLSFATIFCDIFRYAK